MHKKLLSLIILTSMLLSMGFFVFPPQKVGAVEPEGSIDQSFSNVMGRDLGIGTNLTAEVVRVQSDDKVLIGGTFLDFEGDERANGLVRLNTDGTLDEGFTANISGGTNDDLVLDIEVQSDQKIIVAGSFTTFAGVSANRIVRLNSDGTRDGTFNMGTGFGAIVRAVAVQSDGKIIVGGDFTTYKGTSTVRLVRLNTDGSVDTAFYTNLGTNVDALVTSVEVDSSGRILVAGNFLNHNGSPQPRMMRLNSDGTVDATFTTNIGTGPTSGPRAFRFNSDNKIIVGGLFSTFNATSTGGMIVLNDDGTTHRVVTGGGSVYDVMVQPDNKVLAVGNFTTIYGVTRNRFVRLNSDFTVDTSFSTNLGTAYNTTSIQKSISIDSSGSIFVVGTGDRFNGNVVKGLVKVSSNGTFDSSYRLNSGYGLNNDSNAGPAGYVQRPNGKSLYFGALTSFSSTGTFTALNNVVQFNSNNTLDTTFNTNLGTGPNSSLQAAYALQPDGKLLLGGIFTTFNGTTAGRMVRLNVDGTVDTAFMTNTGTGFNSGFVYTIKLQSDGKILVGGSFTLFNGTSAPGIIRLNSNGTVDTTFMTNIGTGPTGSGTEVRGFLIQNDGSIILAGGFPTFNGTSVGRIVRLSSAGVMDTAFNTANGTGFSTTVLSLALQPDGKIIAGGGFTTFNSVSKARFLRLNADGGLDTDFNPTVVGSQVTSIALQGDGKIIFNTSSSPYIRRVNANGTTDSSFTTNSGAFGGAISGLYIRDDNKILATGQFKRVGTSNPRNVVLLHGPEVIPPDIPPPTDLDAGSDTGRSSTDNITNDNTPTFTGTASSSANIYLYNTATETLLGTAEADVSGNYSATSSVLVDGAYSIGITQEKFGIMSATSSPISITVDTANPTQHTLTPLDNATAIATSTTLRIRLTENISTSTGSLKIFKSSDDSLVEEFISTSTRLTISASHTLVAQLTSNLDFSTN